MRARLLLHLCLALGLVLAPAAKVLSQDDEEEEERVFPDDYRVWNKAAVGLNQLITFPADPVMFAVEGDEVFSGAWQPQVTGRVLGLLAGCLQAPYRVLTGSFDFVTFPLAPILPIVSPVPRFEVIPHYHPEE